jgi:hypothetical protein
VLVLVLGLTGLFLIKRHFKITLFYHVLSTAPKPRTPVEIN